MKVTHMVDRRTAVALLAGVATALVGCSSEDGGPDAASSLPEVGEISDNHGHVAQIRAPQLAAAAALELDMQGTANHSHMLALSTDEVRRVRDGERVVRVSSLTNSHSHTVTFN